MNVHSVPPQDGEIHVWFVELSAPEKVVCDAEHLLAPDEKEKASRYCFPHLKQAYVLSRAVLRVLLARYVSSPPESLTFEYGPQGKPRLAWPLSSLHFNLSHSSSLAAYAFSPDCELGIDVELLRPTAEVEQIAKRFFSVEEFHDLMRAGERDIDTAFLTCWVRKEAFIKALGGGLSIPLDSFRVSFLPEETPRVQHIGGSEAEGQLWAMHPLQPGRDYVGALAYRDSARRLVTLPRTRADEILPG